MSTRAVTRTGAIPLGVRRVGSSWASDLPRFLEWADGVGCTVVDLEATGDAEARIVAASDLRLGAVDLPEWGGLMSADEGRRTAAVARNAAYVEACAAVAGALSYFAVMLPEDPARPRADNFRSLVTSLRELAAVLERSNGVMAIEAYPGAGALCCTPETYRALFEACPSPAIGINYDPSHFVRMGIDPVRFLREFRDRVAHVHAKDTHISPERLYELGHQLPAVWAPSPSNGGTYWRYTVPGHGDVPWPEVVSVLVDGGYGGSICVELEDASFEGSPESEQQGLTVALRYLEGC